MPTNTYVALDKITVGTATPSVTFTGISQAYTDLVLVVNGTSASAGDFSLQVGNGSIDTGTNYSMTALYGNGSTATSARSTSSAAIGTGGFYTAQGTIIIQLMNYSNTTTYKTTLNRTNSSDFVQARVGLWRSTAAINTIKYGPSDGSNWSVGTTFSLYGISAIGGTTPKATGGTVTSDATYWYHTFEMSGNFVPNQSLSCDYLVVAGGGGGGGSRAGGGGAGGYLTGSAFSVTAQSYPVTVGGGGAGSATDGGTNGSNSIFSSITSTGGGAGGSIGTIINGVAGGSGGGGGGASSSTGTGGAASPAGQGNAGGFGRWDGSNPRAGGGGGGASAAGGNAFSGATSLGGAGGAGIATSISGTSVTYAGGGGGAVGPGTSTVGAGGAGGGGTGGKDTASGANGTANLGGGGGGGGGTGGNGGSGIVIIRYAK
jgi:hypothetical protein